MKWLYKNNIIKQLEKMEMINNDLSLKKINELSNNIFQILKTYITKERNLHTIGYFIIKNNGLFQCILLEFLKNVIIFLSIFK